MRKLILTLVGMVCMTVVMADDTYPSLTIECADGSTTSLSVNNLTMSVDDISLTAVNDNGTETFTLTDLTKMYFSGTSENTTLKGDVNRDGKVDISDVVAIINTMACVLIYEDADVNNDDSVDISDIVAVINIIAGTESADESTTDEETDIEASDTIQTLNICQGNVIYRFHSYEVDTMTYSNGTTLTVMDMTFKLNEITSMYVDNSIVYDNQVDVVYSDNEAKLFIPGNIGQYISSKLTSAHVVLTQSGVPEEVTYCLSGSSDDGSFYMAGSYKASLDLRGLTLTNPKGAAINIQNSKRIAVSVKKDTENTLKDGVSNTDKGCFVCKGHTEFKGRGVLNIYSYGSSAHGIKSGEYMSIRNCTINVLRSTRDGVHCGEYFLMESGELNVSGAGDDCLQVELDGAVSTGVTTDHEDEDSGNIYILDGVLNLTPTADAVKGMRSAGDIEINGGIITITRPGQSYPPRQTSAIRQASSLTETSTSPAARLTSRTQETAVKESVLRVPSP